MSLRRKMFRAPNLDLPFENLLAALRTSTNTITDSAGGPV